VVNTDAIDPVTMVLVVPVRYGCQHVAIAARYRKTFYVMTGQKRSRAVRPTSPRMVLQQ
jgi:hypothetical protein